MANIHIADDPSQWVQIAVRFIMDSARKALQVQHRFVLALSGGGTPEPVYESLPTIWKEHNLDWHSVQILWGDERCVPLDHPQSNYRMVREALLDKIDIPRSNVHPMRCADSPSSAAAAYEAELRTLYPQQSWPIIDLILLGMGADGHTASLFPGSPAMHEEKRWVVDNDTSSAEHRRLTLTIPAINHAHAIAFLVTGEDKAETLRQVLQGKETKDALPAQRIKPQNGQLHWFLDANAAQYLDLP
ncbi:MAG: 6-phosphogluconolactonase [Anaerolineales bacterium]